MEIEDPGGPLSDPEFRQLIRLLARYAERELDQGDFWKLNTSYRPVHVQMHRGLPSGWPDEEDRLFTALWPLPAHLQEDKRENNKGQQEQPTASVTL
ncbi:MAG: hypothetical protein ACRDP7_48260 [Trebonia sp.]